MTVEQLLALDLWRSISVLYGRAGAWQELTATVAARTGLDGYAAACAARHALREPDSPWAPLVVEVLTALRQAAIEEFLSPVRWTIRRVEGALQAPGREVSDAS